MRHVDSDHNMWHYLYFIVYLLQKPPRDYSGVETYLKEKMDARR
jgi:hypothetical protein